MGDCCPILIPYPQYYLLVVCNLTATQLHAYSYDKGKSEGNM